jgi:hypothetical protein
MVSEPLDERRLLQTFQVMIAGKVAQNFLAPTLEGMCGSLERRKRRTAFREFHRPVLPCPFIDILKQVTVNGAVVSGIEATLHGSTMQLFGALTGGFILECAQRCGVDQSRFVSKDVRVRPKIGVPLVHRKELKRVRGDADAR